MNISQNSQSAACHIYDHILPFNYMVTLEGEKGLVNSIKKVTVNLPEDLLENAKRATGLGITDTIIEGLMEIEKREKRKALSSYKGKIKFDLDLEKTRR